MEKDQVNKNIIGPDLNERYKLLITARNFHYDNFSKWASYFYVAIGALFVAYYSIVSSESIAIADKNIFIYAVMGLGYIFSILWFWSTKGYYFWNINFISLVNYYESQLFKWPPQERVYAVFANKKTQNNYINPFSGANISTSKVAIFFSYLVTITWGLLFFSKLFHFENQILSFLVVIGSSVFATMILSVFVGKYFLNSKIDHMPDLKLDQKLLNTHISENE